MNMEKVLKIISLKDQKSDYGYWLTQSPQVRLDTIEQLRIQYINIMKNVEPRLQRVCRVVDMHKT